MKIHKDLGHYSIHFSPTGGTLRVADILVEGLQGEYQQIDLCHEIDNINMNEGDVCLISVPSYGGRVPAIAIDRLKKITGNGAKAVLNCVYGNRAWEDTLTELQDTLKARDSYVSQHLRLWQNTPSSVSLLQVVPMMKTRPKSLKWQAGSRTDLMLISVASWSWKVATKHTRSSVALH
jgi:flavodoxin